MAVATDQVTTQIWALMSSPQQIVSSMVTHSYFPHVANTVYERQLLHGCKEDEATLVPYMYNSQNLQSPHKICILRIPHRQY
jgi:hypothetical protein